MGARGVKAAILQLDLSCVARGLSRESRLTAVEVATGFRFVGEGRRILMEVMEDESCHFV